MKKGGALSRARRLFLRRSSVRRRSRARRSHGDELDDADLARREQPDVLAGEAEPVADDERRAAGAEDAAIVASDELGEIADATAEERRQRQLAAVRMTGEHEGGAELDRLVEAVGSM